MKLIYVAGKYTGKTYSEIDDNIRKAEALSIKLFREGWAVITPHKNMAHYEIYEDDTLDYHTWLDADFEMLKRCDAIIFLKNWYESPGSREEHDFSEKEEIPIFYEKNGLPSPDDLTEKGKGLKALIK